jgi:hypothetical protein
MVVKPTGNAGWFWGLLAAMVVGIVVVLATYRRAEQQLPAAATD